MAESTAPRGNPIEIETANRPRLTWNTRAILLAAGLLCAAIKELPAAHEPLDKTCDAQATEGSITEFDGSGLLAELDPATVATMDQIPGNSPNDILREFIQSEAPVGVPVKVEPSFDWSAAATPEEQAINALNYRYRTIQAADAAMDLMRAHSPAMLEALGVHQLKFTDEQRSEYTGSFSYGDGVVALEADNFLRAIEPEYVRGVLIHEMFGHGLHQAYCAEYVHNDTGFQPYDYVGKPADSASVEEFKAHYAQVSETDYAYGPNRQLVRPYGATSVEEHLATIAEWTLGSRGLIQEGDTDFGSPLHYDQMEYVRRLEHILPGAKNFLEAWTVVLRQHFIVNEIYLDSQGEPELPVVRVPFVETEQAFQAGKTSLNGLVFLTPEGGKHENIYYPFPEVRPARPSEYIIELPGSDYGSFISDKYHMTAYLLQPPDASNETFVRPEAAQNQLPKELQRTGISSRDGELVDFLLQRGGFTIVELDLGAS